MLMGGDRRSDSSQAADTNAAVPLDVIPLHSTNLLTVLDETGIIHYESPSIERIFGFEQDDLVGEQVADYFHPDDREQVLEAFHSVVESEAGTVTAVEYRHVQADGSYRWVESVGSANPTPSGYYVINTRDISERKAREQNLEHTNERLDAFASVVSHDLRNPLNVAQGRLDLAQQECDNEHLDYAANAVDRSLDLIDQLLTLAHEGDRASNVEAVPLADTLAECWRTVETVNARLVTETEQTILADPSPLKQLLENLVRNAVAHGDGEVTVTVGDLDEGFYIADDGPGIPEHERDRVFEVGYSTKEEGTGFGLRIVEQIADAHGWDVSVTESQEGGTRFEFTGVVVNG